jgi:hypothetical protein
MKACDYGASFDLLSHQRRQFAQFPLALKEQVKQAWLPYGL